MLIKCSAPVESFRGKLGGLDGVVGYPVGGRQIAREMVVPANPDTTPQQTIRGYLSNAAVAFQSLTAAEKADWKATGLLTDLTDAYGQKYNPSAIQLYQRVNCYRQIDGQAITDTAPNYEVQPAPTSVAAAIVAGDLQITITHANTPADVMWAIRVTPAQPSAVRLARRNELRYITALMSDSIVSGGASPQAVTLGQDNFTIVATDAIGIQVIALTDDYLPGGELFDSSVIVT